MRLGSKMPIGKRKMLLKAVLNSSELYDALFEYVVHKYVGKKKRLKEALERGEAQFITYTEMPLKEDENGRLSVQSLAVEIFSKPDGEVSDEGKYNEGLREK
jgi:hypothetical protein